MSKKEKTIRFRKNGFIIEFEKYNGRLLFYIFKKIGAFLVDLSIYVGLLIIFIMVVHSSLLNSFIFTYFLFFLYLIGTIALLKNKTLGMFALGLVFGSKDGDIASKGSLLNRAFITSIYAVPIIGIILMITSLVSMVINKGLTPVDLFSKTQTFTKWFHKDIVYIYEQIAKEQEG